MSSNEHLSRQGVLAGELRGTRRVFRILTAIEVRTAYLQAETRRAINAYLLGHGEFTLRWDHDYLPGLKLRATGDRPTLTALDRYAWQWAPLVPHDEALRVALIEGLRERYGAEPGPRTLAALGFSEVPDKASKTTTEPRDDRFDLESYVDWVHLPGGNVLFHRGDPADALYIVVTGRLGTMTTDGQPRAEMGQGAIIGAAGVLTGEVRPATVSTLRDSELLRIAAHDFHEIVHRHPGALHHVSRDMAAQLQANSSRKNPATSLMTIALLPAGPGVDDAHFRQGLLEALKTQVHVRYVTRDRLETELDVHLDADLQDPTETARVMAWLSQLEREGSCIVYFADPEWTAWSALCVRQADRVLFVANARAMAATEHISAGLHEADVMAKVELALIHPPDTVRAAGTARWLHAFPGLRYHHVRSGNPVDFRRLARRILGKARGLVLSGGGARGFAHVGAIRALREAGIEVDVFGGTSMGALMAAAAARGADDAVILDTCKVFASRRALLDPTLPITSVYRTRKVNGMLASVLGDAAIEDLWHPFFCVSSDLTRAEPRIHESGSLQLAVRASLAIPVIFAPILHDGSLLVDGGVMNNFPLDVMRERCEGGTVIGVWVNPPNAVETAYVFGEDVSGWSALLSRLRIGKTITTPSLINIAMRTIEVNSEYHMRSQSFLSLADILIQPTLRQFASLDFDSYMPIVQAGYEEAHRVLATWQVEAAQAAVPIENGGQ